MKLRASPATRVFLLLFLAVLLASAAGLGWRLFTDDAPWSGRIIAAAVIAFVVPFCFVGARHALGPFRIDVDERGWRVRTRRLTRDVRWDELAAVVLAHSPAHAGTDGSAGTAVPTSRRGPGAPRLLLVPADGVDLGVEATGSSPVDGRPALELFALDDVVYGEVRFVRDLSALAGGRFHNRCAHLTRPPGATPLHRFPDRSAHLRLTRWLGLRETGVFLGWYVLVLALPLALTVLAARWDVLLGVLALLATAVATIAGTATVLSIFHGCRSLAAVPAMIDGRELLTGHGDAIARTDLHSERIRVTPGGARAGYGRASLLVTANDAGRPSPVLLLSDPRTGDPRDRDDLRALAAVLRDSPHGTGRDAARHLDALAAGAPPPRPRDPDDDLPASEDPVDLRGALAGMLRPLALGGCVATVAAAAALTYDAAPPIAAIFIVTASVLTGVWFIYTLICVRRLADAVLTPSTRATRPLEP
ncbi:hypothetical protein [Virgisporangium ochraceum]|uniref:PH domain-containing protein n=1 Tax=Virgisporangium ochraceum TaxID=65505 RepID=A0A8J3ZVM5_9ACTN|nr:hypothetical protein [Virgisporangium ochraceum]GIJ70799.1 hypothetical protein Voc01_057160 [Virgisporangium ochraceum]